MNVVWVIKISIEIDRTDNICAVYDSYTTCVKHFLHLIRQYISCGHKINELTKDKLDNPMSKEHVYEAVGDSTYYLSMESYEVQ